MNFKSEQELYDYIGTFLIKQGKQSKNGDICLYRGPNGIKCAVGCVLSDHYYRKDMDYGIFSNGAYTATQLIKTFKVPKFFEKFGVFLNDAQYVHDCDANWDGGPNDFKEAWRIFGYARGLNISKFE